MTPPEDYCELCDLPRSQCVHGRPPPEPAPAARPKTSRTTTPKPRKKATPQPAASVPPTKRVNRRFTPPDDFKPLILEVLRNAGGRMEADDLYLELEILVEDRLLPGDNEKTPAGELRWQYAARRARLALIEEGRMTKGRPGIWQLA